MLLLASQSPRRRQLLAQLGVDFAVVDVDVPELQAAGESALDYVSRVARAKGLAALERSGPSHWILSADTEVVLGDEVFGKPADADQAMAMLQRLSGREHQVISVVWLIGHGQQLHAISQTSVHVEPLDARAIAAYVESGECYGKAGAYAIQGRFAAHVALLHGSHSGVMGLPLHETSTLLRRAGLI